MEYTDQYRSHYEEHGYVRLGRLLDAADLAELQQRIDAIMLGEIDCPGLDFQLDGDEAEYAKMPEVSPGHKGATLAYRKIQDLEYDKVFLDYLQKPLFHHICARIYGAASRVACYRAMFMNKPAGYGTDLKWHQDRWQSVDRCAAAARPIYKLIGSEDDLIIKHPDCGHDFPEPLRQAAYRTIASVLHPEES